METVVKFNRCLYAQLVQQQYEGARQVSMPEQDDPRFQAASLGIKLTAGFEILCSELPGPTQRPAAPASTGNASSETSSQPGLQPSGNLTAASDRHQPAAASEPGSSSISYDASLSPSAVPAANDKQSAAAAGTDTRQSPSAAQEGSHPGGESHAARTGQQSAPARLHQDPGWHTFKSRLQSLDWFQVRLAQQ